MVIRAIPDWPFFASQPAFFDFLGVAWYRVRPAAVRFAAQGPKMAEFQVGDKTVYPGYGVAEITKIENREISGSLQRFYVLRVLGKEMTLMVPMSNADSVGLRNIIGAVEVEQVYEVLRKRGEKISTATWNRRYREYMEKIRTGSLTEIATVLRDLCLLRSDKDLSYGERNMLETARALLVQELALAKGQGEEAVEAEIEALFGKP
jgi:CarD family transcriptional regulator